MNNYQGGCLCGAIRYQVKATPQSVVICHCTHCQRASGSAFSVNLLINTTDYEQQGETKFYIDHGDSGLESYRHFCPHCGSSIMTQAQNLPNIILVKAGTLDHHHQAEIKPQLEIYTDHAVQWHVTIAGATCFHQAPTT